MMFDETGMEILKQSSYDLLEVNFHDATIHSPLTGHDWIIVSNYEDQGCYILHRHSARYPYHRQQGRYKSLKEAIKYIDRHEKWFTTKH